MVETPRRKRTFRRPSVIPGFGLSFDAKKYFVSTTARWYAGSTLAIETEHKLDPWVLSAGVSVRF